MRLIKCYIENFGILSTQEISFTKGLNCCISENGTGKTTLTAFIEAMLYGIGEGRKQSLDENARKKYTPWQGGRFGGSLTIEVGKKRYVIERTFGAKAAGDTFRLIDADTGKESSDFGENIGESLFGIDRDGFLRTVFLSEKNLQGKNENKTISAKLSDLVGVDGDVGGIDDAIKLLEERRKFYYKKGNTGEIANVRAKISDVEIRLDNLTRLEGETREREHKLRELNNELASLTAIENEQKQRLEDLRRRKEKSASEERYSAMLETLKKEKARLAEVQNFFASGMPTTAQVDYARDMYVEADRLKNEALAEKGNEEYFALAEYFKNGTSFVEIAEMEKIAERLDEIRREKDVFDGGFDQSSVEMRKLFADKVPTDDDIAAMEKAANSSRSFTRALVLLLGLGAMAGGALIGSGVGYAIAGVGALVSLFSLIFLGKSKKSKQMLAIARNFNGCECSNLKGIVDELKKKLARYNELKSVREASISALDEERETLTIRICSFLEKFPLTEASTMGDAVKIIRDRYTHFDVLSKAGEVTASGKIEKIKRSEELMRTARAFLERFPTKTDSPFAEIRDRISDFNYIGAGVSRLERECDAFAVRYGVTGKAVETDTGAEAAANATLSEVAKRCKEITEAMALLGREIGNARIEIEKRDEYLMEKEELEQMCRKYVDNLETIKKTSALLSEACDNITSKYLGKTKAKFEEYSSLIAGAKGEYALSTSFELTKTERGEAHGIESYSRGTRDLYALGLRLALADALYENEAPFIILDDPFIALDDAKLEKAKATLKSIGKTKQILYFTCAKSRAID